MPLVVDFKFVAFSGLRSQLYLNTVDDLVLQVTGPPNLVKLVPNCCRSLTFIGNFSTIPNSSSFLTL